MSESRHARAVLGGLIRRGHTESSPEVLAARARLREAKVADAISKALAGAPPLTQDQRNRLAILLLNPDTES